MDLTRRFFLRSSGLGAMALGSSIFKACTGEKSESISDKPIQGFDESESNTDTSKSFVQTSDRRIRVGIVGYGVCKFGAAFGFQNHPNVEVVAVSDLIPERCARLAQACRCEKSYPSLEQMVTDDEIEAIFVATDAPSHARHCIEVMKHGKHVATAVPALWADIEDAERLLEMVKKTGLKYMMFETTTFRNKTYAMREIYNAGGFGNMIYTEGEYFHYFPTPLASYKEWRKGLPPMWYCTHSTGYYISVTGGSITEVSCMGMPSIVPHLTQKGNDYKNSFGTEIGLFRTSEGGMARFAVSWDTPGGQGETGRVHGQRGSFDSEYRGTLSQLPNLKKPPLPPGVRPGGHGGSHGYLMHDFVMSIIEDRKPLVDIATALNMTVPGLLAHQSALRDGEIMMIPQYAL
jgi:predicted dehydrogenase